MKELTLKQARESLQMTKLKLAKQINMSISNLSKIEHQEHKPKEETKEKIQEFFNQYDIRILWQPKKLVNVELDIMDIYARLEKLEKVFDSIKEALGDN